jgi:outer membrane lipoprotein SlyB
MIIILTKSLTTGIVKKLLFALKAESFSREILPDFLRAFRALVKANMSADVLRSLSLFITYSLHKHNPSRPLRVKKSNIQMRRPGSLIPGALGGPMGSSMGGSMGGSILAGAAGPKSGYLGVQGELNEEGSFTRQQIGVMMLEMYEELLAEEGNGMAVIKKFAKTVTNKVCLCTNDNFGERWKTPLDLFH